MTPEQRREYEARFVAMHSFRDVIRLRLWLRRMCGAGDPEAEHLRGQLAYMAYDILPDYDPPPPRIGRD
jgi:hypothetical protein